MEAPSVPGTAIEVPSVPESAMEASTVPEEADPVSEAVIEASSGPKVAAWVVPLNEAVTTTEAAPVPKAVKEASPVPEKTVSIPVASTEATPLPEAAKKTPSVPETATEYLRPHLFENIRSSQVWPVLGWETAAQAFRTSCGLLGPAVDPALSRSWSPPRAVCVHHQNQRALTHCLWALFGASKSHLGRVVLS